jgi:hypothetical protein
MATVPVGGVIVAHDRWRLFTGTELRYFTVMLECCETHGDAWQFSSENQAGRVGMGFGTRQVQHLTISTVSLRGNSRDQSLIT